MEIGFLTWYFKSSTVEDLLTWASDNGMSGLELDNCPEDLPRMKKLLSRYPQVKVHALGRSQNYLIGTPSERAQRSI